MVVEPVGERQQGRAHRIEGRPRIGPGTVPGPPSGIRQGAQPAADGGHVQGVAVVVLQGHGRPAVVGRREVGHASTLG
ncbi:hypothetical protein BJF82_06830 [Kytococcus sp. CUA-901]|nr:hypothetical protein BJF82_06830 [Kytococcus sp. CUA-901]